MLTKVDKIIEISHLISILAVYTCLKHSLQQQAKKKTKKPRHNQHVSGHMLRYDI